MTDRTPPTYIVARYASPSSAPMFYTAETLFPWTTHEQHADRFDRAEARQLRDDLADHDAVRGIGGAFAVLEEIDTPSGPAHRELTPQELDQ